MTIVHVLQGFAGTWGTGGGGTNAYTYGLPFVPAVNGAITELRWYRPSTGTPAPGNIALWRRSDGARMSPSGIAVPDGAGTGWKSVTLPSPVTVVAGVEYMVSAYFAAGGGEPWAAAASYPTLPAQFSAPSHLRYVDSGNAYPNTGDDLYFQGIDVTLDTSLTGSTPPPDTSTALDNSLVAWLADNGDNTHRQGALVPGLPDITNNNVLAWLARGGEITSGDATSYSLRDATLAGAAIKILDYLVTNGSNINGLISALNTVKGWLGTNGSAPPSWDMYGQIQDMSTQIYAIKAKVDAMTVPVAPSSWVSLGTMDFTADLAWAQAADVYTITYSDLGSATVNLTIGAVDIAYRLLWWAIWDGERMRDRRFADGTLPVLYDGGARMPGIVLHSPAGASGTVEAWTLT